MLWTHSGTSLLRAMTALIVLGALASWVTLRRLEGRPILHGAPGRILRRSPRNEESQ